MHCKLALTALLVGQIAAFSLFRREDEDLQTYEDPDDAGDDDYPALMARQLVALGSEEKSDVTPIYVSQTPVVSIYNISLL